MGSPVGQIADGSWEIGVRRTFPVDRAEAWALVSALLEDDPAVGEVRSVTPEKVIRVNYQPAEWTQGSTLQLRVMPAVTGTTVAIHHEGLADAAARETMRRHWTAALERMRPS